MSNQLFIRIFISIILGLGLASLFQRVCTGRNCIIYKSPNYSDIVGKTFQSDGKCFVYSKESASCQNI